MIDAEQYQRIVGRAYLKLGRAFSRSEIDALVEFGGEALRILFGEEEAAEVPAPRLETLSGHVMNERGVEIDEFGAEVLLDGSPCIVDTGRYARWMREHMASAEVETGGAAPALPPPEAGKGADA